ncbi:hypothetical protein [Novosphingobium sp. M1R2S20]|uniref:Uncharacterized protein n=1 Tax=Novosphingobium rhizovicinum TaxID=3228928 RepID=A0ABV3RDA7_9SPHN
MMRSVRKGLFRTHVPGIGECARVDMRAGDAAPYLDREMYSILGFEPAYDTLPRYERADGGRRAFG